MSEQRLDQLKDKCPECGSKYLVRDNETGELACSSCGAVLEEVEYVPDFVPRTVERGSFAYAGLPATGKPTRYELLKYRDHRYLYMIGRGESRERIVADIAAYVSILAGRLGVNSKVVE
ncbi:MAG: TFIIB-type zinc ribbon-containing protein, partial [Thermoproteota archaeon]